MRECVRGTVVSSIWSIVLFKGTISDWASHFSDAAGESGQSSRRSRRYSHWLTTIASPAY